MRNLGASVCESAESRMSRIGQPRTCLPQGLRQVMVVGPAPRGRNPKAGTRTPERLPSQISPATNDAEGRTDRGRWRHQACAQHLG